jgi:hypothetical protein
MPALLVALVLLVAVGLGIAWLRRANPAAVARQLRFGLMLLAAIAAGGLLIFGVRFLPSFLPELMGLGGVLLAGFVARVLRRGSIRGFSTPGQASQRTETRTAFIEAWIDHATGEVGGRVLKGRFAGRLLDSLADAELIALHAEYAADAETTRILEAYFDRRLGADWRRTQQQSAPSGATGSMTRSDAFAVLGLAEGASGEEIQAAYRRLIQRVHPDVGGSADLAARINRAKDILLGG